MNDIAWNLILFSIHGNNCSWCVYCEMNRCIVGFTSQLRLQQCLNSINFLSKIIIASKFIRGLIKRLIFPLNSKSIQLSTFYQFISSLLLQKVGVVLLFNKYHITPSLLVILYIRCAQCNGEPHPSWWWLNEQDALLRNLSFTMPSFPCPQNFQHFYHMTSFKSLNIVLESGKCVSLPNTLPFRDGHWGANNLTLGLNPRTHSITVSLM